MAAIWLTVGLVAAAVAAAMVAGWRRHATETVPVARAIEGPTCYPKVAR